MTNALVVGGADCALKDVEAALRLGEFDGVITVNDITIHWPGDIHAAVSLHSEKWNYWLIQRQRANRPMPRRVFAHLEFRTSNAVARQPPQITDYVEYKFPSQKDSGSSGLFGVKVALMDLGYDRAVICGIPMTAEGRHFFDKRPWGGAASMRRGWKQALPYLSRVRSMGGWTAELLGKPTVEWMRDGEEGQASSDAEGEHHPACQG